MNLPERLKRNAKRVLKRSALGILLRLGYPPPQLVRADVFPTSGLGLYPDDSIYDVCAFAINQSIQGDFLEFGVHTGASFKQYYKYYTLILSEYLKADFERFSLLTRTKFFAFDSFEGLPDITHPLDLESGGFEPGEYSTTKDIFLRNMADAEVDLSKIVPVEGFYKDSLTEEVYARHSLKAASIVSIDCDLYESTADVLTFITPLLVNGTLIVFNDWVVNLHSPKLGEQRAFHEWRMKNSNLRFSRFIANTGWNFSAFVVHKDVDFWPEDFGQIA